MIITNLRLHAFKGGGFYNAKYYNKQIGAGVRKRPDMVIH